MSRIALTDSLLHRSTLSLVLSLVLDVTDGVTLLHLLSEVAEAALSLVLCVTLLHLLRPDQKSHFESIDKLGKKIDTK